MTRLLAAWFAFLCLVPPATATLFTPRDSAASRPNGRAATGHGRPLGTETEFNKPGQSEEFTVTNETEVTLNGRACKYKDIPGTARIIHLEVASDKKTVLRIDFRSRR
jgi:hypothetical protein